MRRPGEISVAAAVVFLGSGLVMFCGLFVATLYGLAIHSVGQKYPGQDFSSVTNPIIPGFQTTLVSTMYICVTLGIVGFITGLGLLRMRPWARQSIIAWCIISTLACLLALLRHVPPSTLHFGPRGILTLMLFLFPVNAWWLMLFFRPEIKSEFASAGAPERNDSERDARWRRLARPRFPGDFGK